MNESKTPSRLTMAKTLFALLGAPIVFVFLIIASSLLHGGLDNAEFGYTFLIGIAGVSTGWLIGFLASPYTSSEDKKFSRFATAIAGFLTGYVVSTVDPVVTYLFEDARLILQPIYGARLLVFLACLCVAAINMYMYRLYLTREKP